MAKIYSKISRVIVWLGEKVENSDIMFEVIRAVGKPINILNKEMI